MKVIPYADRDGWKAALHYVGNNIVEIEAQAKKMQKFKKETEKEREAERSRRERDRRVYSSGREGQSSSRNRYPQGFQQPESKLGVSNRQPALLFIQPNGTHRS